MTMTSKEKKSRNVVAGIYTEISATFRTSAHMTMTSKEKKSRNAVAKIHTKIG
jgi:hypothetical protein